MYTAEMLACDLVHEKISIFALEMVVYDAPLARAHVRPLANSGRWPKRTEKGESRSMDGFCSCMRRTEPTLKSLSALVFFTLKENRGVEDGAQILRGESRLYRLTARQL